MQLRWAQPATTVAVHASIRNVEGTPGTSAAESRQQVIQPATEPMVPGMQRGHMERPAEEGGRFHLLETYPGTCEQCQQRTDITGMVS